MSQTPLLEDHIKLLSLSECIEIVANTLNIAKDKVNIINFKINYTSEDVFGFLGDYFRLTITINNEKDGIENLCYFIKSLPIKNIKRRELIEHYGMFGKEVNLYAYLLPKLGGIDIRIIDYLYKKKNKLDNKKWRPKCFLVRSDLLVLEDLLLEKYCLVKYRSSFNKTHIKCTLKTIAQLHSDSINYEIKYNTKIDQHYNKILFETSICKTNSWFITGLNAVKYVAENHSNFEKYRQQLKDDKFWNNIEPIFEDAKNSKIYRNVFCHRDLWFNNIMFKYNENQEPIHCVLVDFQIGRYCPAAVDVMTFIYLTTRRTDRQQNFEEYLQFYYEYLTDELRKLELSIDTILPWLIFRESCNKFKLLSLAYNCVFYPLTHLPAGTLMNMEKNEPELHNLICNKNRNKFIYDFIEKDKYYGEIVLEVYDELLNEIL